MISILIISDKKYKSILLFFNMSTKQKNFGLRPSYLNLHVTRVEHEPTNQ